MPKINMQYMPSPKHEYSMDYGNLAGGLNIFELSYRLKRNESPDMQNLVWKDGCLNSRDGQIWVDDTDRVTGYAAYDSLFHGYLFWHAGTKIWCLDPTDDEGAPTAVYTSANLSKRGTFFLYDTKLYYKAPGVYAAIEWTGSGFTSADVEGYVPVTYVNCSPVNGAGAAYQPENRISAKKTLWYNAASGVDEYHLPVLATSVGPIYVDDVEQIEGTDYSYDSSTGVVSFTTAPPVTVPATNNTVKITYTLENETAMSNIMDCPYAKTYGGTGALCVVMGGCSTQSNAYFWNGSNIAMDATYFPMTQYQLAGDSSDPITGFGLQQSFLVIFKERSVGRTKLDTADVDGRLTIDMPYVPINAKIGCDLPWTIQLVDNNLVWCNTEQGVHLLKDSSAAYENNIVCISMKVNGSKTRKGLFDDVRSAGQETVCSCDDTRKYWVVAKGHAWVWDYSLSDYKDPSWFFFTNIHAMAFVVDNEDVYHVDGKGRVTFFKRIFADYPGDPVNEAPIEKVYQFATQYFGSYDNLKNVNSIIISMRSDTNGTTRLTYLTDYETREDLTPLMVRHWRLWPRNLRYRSLEGTGFAEVFRRRPMCRRVKHYTMRLTNNGLGEDLSVVTAQVFYNFQGKDRGRQIP